MSDMTLSKCANTALQIILHSCRMCRYVSNDVRYCAFPQACGWSGLLAVIKLKLKKNFVLPPCCSSTFWSIIVKAAMPSCNILPYITWNRKVFPKPHSFFCPFGILIANGRKPNVMAWRPLVPDNFYRVSYESDITKFKCRDIMAHTDTQCRDIITHTGTQCRDIMAHTDNVNLINQLVFWEEDT
jgi:hypothetical protein